MDVHAGHPPQHILGYTIRSRTRIYVSYLLPAVLELICFIIQISADAAVSYQHFRSHQPEFGWATLGLVLMPPVLTFVFVLSSPDQWVNPRYTKQWHFLAYQVFFLLLFPFVAIYRFARRVFWSIESLFHDDDDEERMACLEKAHECSTCELYHLIQAYGQSAPQIMLQLYHMLTQDLFRNFETTNVQAISLFFSAVDVAAVTATYQRFESQKLVGRYYPWSSAKQITAQQERIAADKRFRDGLEKRKRESEQKIASFPENDKIMFNFYKRNTDNSDEMNSNDAATVDTAKTTVLLHHHNFEQNEATDKSSKILRLNSELKAVQDPEGHQLLANDIEILDTAPESPAPTLPPIELRATTEELKAETATTGTADSNQHHNKRTSNALSQLDILKNMLIVNAQLYIKEHMPRPPRMLLTRVDYRDTDNLMATPPNSPTQLVPPAPHQKDDVADPFLPHSTAASTTITTKAVTGILQDDFAGKTIAFFGWISFIIMRILSLSTFFVFFPKTGLIVVGVHYSLMLAALFLEARFGGKLNRTLFYMLLAYVFVFVLLEFRVKFSRVRLWIIGYFLLTMTENIAMTMIWYSSQEFESWWFDFIFEGIIYSGVLFMSTFLVYYLLLKPKEVTLVMEVDE